jgi:ribose transport system substrate-binding protein
MRTFSWKVVTAVLGVGLLAAACGSSSASSTATTTAAAAATSTKANKGPFVIDLSNTSLNNGWRLEMQAIAKLVAATPPYNKLVKFNIVNAANNVPAQIASVNAMIAAHVSAIIIDANSPTALNGVMDKAVAAGIPVFSIDSPTTSTKVYHIGENLKEDAYINAVWLAEQLHGKGNVVIDQGIVGTGGEQAQEAGALLGFKQFPGIHIVDQFSGQWATAPSESGMATVLATHPNINGVWTSGGGTGVIEAFLQAHRPLVPVTGFTFNDFLLQPFQHPGLAVTASSNPTYMSALALEDAVKVLEGHKVSKNIVLPDVQYEYPKLLNLPVKLQSGWVPPSYKLDTEGVSAVPGFSAQFSAPYNPPGFHLTAKQVAAAM